MDFQYQCRKVSISKAVQPSDQGHQIRKHALIKWQEKNGIIQVSAHKKICKRTQ